MSPYIAEAWRRRQLPVTVRWDVERHGWFMRLHDYMPESGVVCGRLPIAHQMYQRLINYAVHTNNAEGYQPGVMR